MRNPLGSWDKSDSYFDNESCYIGEKDMVLAKGLIKAGSDHRKFLRQIFVSVDITAPVYWWKEFDTYKVGTTANSTSTMHTLSKHPITLECFETDDYNDTIEQDEDVVDIKSIASRLISDIEQLRQLYIQSGNKKIWKEIVRWLPMGWLQTRTVTMTYENILNMCRSRSTHKLNEWSGGDNPELPNFISWAHTLPYSDELIFCKE